MRQSKGHSIRIWRVSDRSGAFSPSSGRLRASARHTRGCVFRAREAGLPASALRVRLRRGVVERRGHSFQILAGRAVPSPSLADSSPREGRKTKGQSRRSCRVELWGQARLRQSWCSRPAYTASSARKGTEGCLISSLVWSPTAGLRQLISRPILLPDPNPPEANVLRALEGGG